MGSTLCVRCGAILIPSSYCEVCDNVLCFKCSSCSMITDERIHAFCQNADIVNGLMNNGYFNNYDNLQNQLNDEIKHNSIKLSSSFWFNTFECIKLINKYWTKIYNIGNSSTNYRIS